MRLMMHRWWSEGEGDRAWWVIESVFLRSPDKGFMGMPRGFTPRHAQTAGGLGFGMQFNAEALPFRTATLSSGQILLNDIPPTCKWDT